MKVEISVREVVNIFKQIQQKPENIFEVIRVEIKEKRRKIRDVYQIIS